MINIPLKTFNENSEKQVVLKQQSPPFSYIKQYESLPRDPILNRKLKSITFGSERIDKYLQIEEGINLFYGNSNTGKTNSCLTLAFNALENDFNVLYYDLERGVHPKRLLQMYEAREKPFSYDKLYDCFVTPKKLEWKEVINDLERIVVFEKPDLLVLDAFSPIFLKAFFTSDKTRWRVTNERELLVLDTLQRACDNHMIIIIVAHAKNVSPIVFEDEKEANNIIVEPEFSGIGNRFRFLGKLWLYFCKHVIKDNLYRYMLIMKHKHEEDYYSSKIKIPFRITDRGVE